MERITWDNCVGPARYGHEFRYRLAAGFVETWLDRVIDAACGVGYGRELLRPSGAAYRGFDRIDEVETVLTDNEYVQVDLENWSLDSAFEIFLGFEAIEHIRDYWTFIKVARQARKWILLSTPVVPTRHLNPHHVHDFAPGDLQRLFENDEWEHYQTVQQPSELSEIVVLRRRT